ncbi:3-dehydroquinate synthase [Keratinibaculum paraultunense]|uniref:3-dehydroquinate synthase n=1 Tax=Keratinibaculum paraultunense TaxID=1278232 RepID=A0A4R3L3P3_9FIRM|nr:3-dehydroquinate synthase [Keratinibaculum paraultunense]QQY80521.1 3-dehydroquinate synthase [Keratinibaculum paraultunense]TCS91243.1 3-dehydroquinate synthase [Keratinibaculum paraultunense]
MNIFIDKYNLSRFYEYVLDESINRIYIITDKIVNKLYIEYLKSYIDNNIETYVYVLPPGEENKTIENVLLIYDDLIQNNIDRQTLIVSFGGGVVGDIAGFVASTYKRGIKYIQIPTTFLSQVDSSIGGKTGFDYKGFKNIIGTFYFPERIFIDVSFLKSLSKREIICGLGEVFKYGLIADYSLFQFIKNNFKNIYDKNLDILMHIVNSSVNIKHNIVSKDKYDKGLRNILNFGHTIGHSIESYYNFSKYNHGEAVILGMMYEFYIALELSLIDKEYFAEVYNTLSFILPPISFTRKEIEDLIHIMKNDKKNIDNNIAFVLPIDKGKVDVFYHINENLIIKALEGDWF